MKVELFKGKDGWRWRMVGTNGEILSTSEAYANKASAERTVKLVKDALANRKHPNGPADRIPAVVHRMWRAGVPIAADHCTLCGEEQIEPFRVGWDESD